MRLKDTIWLPKALYVYQDSICTKEACSETRIETKRHMGIIYSKCARQHNIAHFKSCVRSIVLGAYIR